MKAIIIENNKILTIQAQDLDGYYYLLPGGGQRPGETMIEALNRECMEEINSRVLVGDIKLIREYIGLNHEFRDTDGDAHQIEYMFECQLEDMTDLKMGISPDQGQMDIAWLDLDNIEQYRLYPQSLRSVLADLDNSPKIYWGDVN